MDTPLDRVRSGDRLKTLKPLMIMEPIYYISTALELATAEETGLLIPPSFHDEGFIHCSFGHQTQGVLNKHFGDHHELIILEVDRTRLAAPVIEENLSGGADLYPHIYGTLNLSAIQRKIPLTKKEGESFDWLTALSR